MPKRPQKIEIEKYHTDLLLRFDQAVTKNDPNFLGTALIQQHARGLRDYDKETESAKSLPDTANSCCWQAGFAPFEQPRLHNLPLAISGRTCCSSGISGKLHGHLPFPS
jgi:hypothetical protein